MARTAAIVPAAGRGERLGVGTPKALRPISGTPMLVHAVRSLEAARCVDLIVIVAPEEHVGAVRAMFEGVETSSDLHVVTGGETRQASVARGLITLPDDVDVVLVHDAARPLVPADVVGAVVAAVQAGNPAVIPGIPVVDTIKRVDDSGVVQATVDRSELRAVQTPQGFQREVLQRVHAEAEVDEATDDAGLVEAAGIPVVMIEGHEEALKVTRPLDLLIAEAIVAKRRSTGSVT
jgi:2-C-methyl-D-erythritol 4-phosphate cytidylyltransferase